MIELNATTLSMTPVEVGGLALKMVDPGAMTLIAPFTGCGAAASAALKAATGLGFAEPGRVLTQEGLRQIWWGRSQVMVTGTAPDLASLADLAAVTDQSDGWAVMRLTGVGYAKVLARLCPVDLRPQQVPVDRVVRSQLGHMQAAFVIVPEGVEIFVFRSMIKTAWQELHHAMRGFAARASL